MFRSPSPAPGWHRPAAPQPTGGPAGFDWFGLYQSVMQLVAYAVYGGALLLLVALFTWPRPEIDDGRETHLQRAQRVNLSLEYKRRGNISEPCRLLLANFADAFADFMACTVKASRPLAVCIRCAQNRYPLERAYQHILSGTGPDDAHCRLQLLDHDDVHIIMYHMRYYQSVVAQNRCDRCVTKLGFGGYKINADISELTRRHDAFRACVERNGNRTAADGSPAVCRECADLLRAQADQLEAVSGRRMHPAGAICADVEDMVNVTSRMWRCAGCRPPAEVTGESGWTAHAPAAVAAVLVAAFYLALGRRQAERCAQEAAAGRGAARGQQPEPGRVAEVPFHRPLRPGERLRPPGPGERFPRLVQEVHAEEIRPPALPADAAPRSSCTVM
ncbi:osteopetrosis-associated transmembrane protein 1-like [Amphibalanus amphitrite]|uniref:osteopetrosis-associated transmembrane protein 1-like n=1 Tax=Amphibalanus amphitrite TaxID=1232801 RepID=UPI001C901FB0|nr:osteopetrosis-associated transmembrane protein 1-like [Amphibalanus amphitrite]XP_043244292.1 osteopetrosis-associated transmembrane protein 1-like [Amphibalanus amphitrite]